MQHTNAIRISLVDVIFIDFIAILQPLILALKKCNLLLYLFRGVLNVCLDQDWHEDEDREYTSTLTTLTLFGMRM
ncbi:unnamed protein product [Amoebophrya sp. A120]|nr:unnamed protein product [Amoebophrya sp. A120]|eukprot:GSA120T00004273001.1